MTESVNYTLINATGELVAFCDQAKQHGWLVVDTEFVRTRTLYAELGLLQAKAGDQLILVDPLLDIDLSPLWALLRDPNMVTVVHAAGEDLEIFHRAKGAPADLFDTQIAHAFLTDGKQIGYAGLVELMLNVELDKSQSRTDWLQRPLTKHQLDYAAADVEYLSEIYPRMRAQAVDSGKEALILAECKEQVIKRGREPNAQFAWRDVGGISLLNGQQRAILRELTIWRLALAREHNIALPFIAKDHALIEIARTEARSRYGLSQIEELHPISLRRYSKDILACVEKGLAVPESEYPEAIPRFDQDGAYKRYFREAKAVLKEIAAAEAIPASMLGSRKQINDVYVWENFTPDSTRSQIEPPDLYSGWRGALLKEALRSILP
ncbi:ribonuclease D [Aliidiomarina halalkaliphila]|uniref:Ribonuclease D n=1 Tax=Aliidiomarina halalkaliphila TaxID=2593535 RepID=A0A552X501_9GAMM|nr:ribonuclease D [Aliidiomarina halalkaliphila]TRW50097.1 ribonuclease D [Aliidiomarina halalkaliphila]